MTTKKNNAGPRSARGTASLIAKETNELRRKLLLVGYLSERISRRGGSIFLVGGQAVETYTGGQFTTGDVDITTTDKKATEEILLRMGFRPEGMVFYSERMGVALHIVADYPRRTIRSKKIKVGRFSVNVVGVEDLIVDRLAAAKFWKSARDLEQASALYAVFAARIDDGYLKSLAHSENVEDLLQSIIKQP